jgi:hypothetical protein
MKQLCLTKAIHQAFEPPYQPSLAFSGFFANSILYWLKIIGKKYAPPHSAGPTVVANTKPRIMKLNELIEQFQKLNDVAENTNFKKSIKRVISLLEQIEKRIWQVRRR